ncbi:MAG TPA: RNA-binding cell elongation regulator Jag/EloR [Bacilli bacterium]|jgi:spoIIIJ-associated protein|nr:KH domain-containing protein [Bacilli bacterium]HOR20357.1 RNA-binding cell elongation regulator Jag/EloR [Bacilli bacterium]HPV69934.1 RNA-binding cell elongation regulator Jag/EloR [Bacilli bacterium]
MKKYQAKTIDEALEMAAQELGILPSDVNFAVQEEKKGLFKKVTIEVYELSDAIEFAEEYLKNVTAALGIQSETTTVLKDDIIHISLNSDHNPILIGKNGKTLQALNELARLAVSSKFKKRFRILLDINDYKDGKYSRVAFAARKAAKEVQKTKMDATLEPMPADERRVVHNALANFSHIKTESAGEGHHRAVVIKYVD